MAGGLIYLLSEPRGRNADLIEYIRGFSNQEEVAVFGTHYVQEVSPHAIGRALARWISSDENPLTARVANRSAFV